MFVDQHEKRDLISRARGMQIPNPGSVSRRAGCDTFDFSPRIGAVGGHFATVSQAGKGGGGGSSKLHLKARDLIALQLQRCAQLLSLLLGW
jgi:hypothetical protein